MDVEKFATKMDRLGMLVFLYVFVYSALSLRNGFDVMTLILLLVGIGGFAVDSFIVFNVRRGW